MRSFFRSGVAWLFLIIIIAVGALVFFPTNLAGPKEVSFSQFQERLERGEVREVQVSGQDISGKWSDGTAFRTVGPINGEGLSNALVERDVAFSFEPEEDTSLLV